MRFNTGVTRLAALIFVILLITFCVMWFITIRLFYQGNWPTAAGDLLVSVTLAGITKIFFDAI